MLIDKGILGGRREEVLLFVVTVLGLVGGDVGEEFEVIGGSGGDRGTGDNIGGGVRDVEEREIFNVVKGGPDECWRWGARGRSDGRGGAEGIGTGTWVVPSVEVRVEDFKDSGGGVGNVLLIYIIKGRPRSDRDLGKGGGGDDGGLRSVKRHLILN